MFHTLLRWTGLILSGLVILLAGVWTALALWFQVRPPWLWFWFGVLALAVVTALVLLTTRPAVAAVLVLAGALLTGGWYSTIRPSNDLVWAADVEHGVTGDVNGSMVTLHNVRDFDWRSNTDFTPRWQTRTVDIDTITSLDLFSSVWSNPAIAHTLISFGFADGSHIVFSAEIRKQEGQEFSSLGGFFRVFNLVLIAATEEDIIKVRTNVRGEDVSVYRLKIPREAARELFLLYIASGNRLAQTPKFYNTLTTNCTTVIFQLARLIDPGIPIDWRILLSGYVPDYLYDHEAIDTSKPLAQVKEEARISAKARTAPAGVPYSQAIRAP